jgi:hypothetical protein
VIVLDRMLASGIKFVLGRIASAVDAEMNDDSRLREELLAAQMRFELGEIGEEEFRRLERDLLARLRQIRERQMGEAPRPGEMKVTGIEATIHGEE